MLHKYKKTATIQAEQFDGSEKMMKHYGIHEANVPPMVTDLKAQNHKLLALIFVVIESIITFVGIGISVYVMWKWKQ